MIGKADFFQCRGAPPPRLSSLNTRLAPHESRGSARSGTRFARPPLGLTAARDSRRSRCAWVEDSSSGFTFIEMVMVIVVMGILLGIAIPVYQAQVRTSKEAVLKHNLAIIRERLDQFKADRNKYPASLQELVETGYLREIPEDPMTRSTEWEEVFTDYDPNEPDAEPGISDIKSRSEETATDGKAYSEW